ncbi:unnamed protein product [Toxocara canis]|uniref:Aldose 1-epimerase n=1 Tax=Toxocara canis TaxID=6265 RepID=A0A183UAI2_TOXCA|nr:unnamed protein product [Toxocara canis]
MTFSKPLIDGFGKCNFRVTTSQNNVESVMDGHCAELIKETPLVLGGHPDYNIFRLLATDPTVAFSRTRLPS